MKYIFTIAALSSLVMASCSTAYKAAQTPDDVYYSPAKEVQEYQTVATRDRYQENINYQEDRFLRMKVQNHDRWSTIDDYSYWYDSRYDYNMYNSNFYYNNYAMNNWHYGFGYNPWYTPGLWSSGYYGYNSLYAYNGYGFYSPAYPVIYYKNPKVYTGITGKSNLGTYLNTRYYNSNAYQTPNRNNEGGFGNLVRKVFAPADNNSNNNNSFERPARTLNNGSNSTGSSSAGGRSGGYSSSGSSTSSSRPPR